MLAQSGAVYTVGEAAEQLGVRSHVLRHWEDVGVLVPQRSAAGHRRYDDGAVARGRVVQRCQAVGMTLEQIRRLLDGDRRSRRTLVDAKRAQLHEQQHQIGAAIAFLDHTLQCRHRLIDNCPECRDFAGLSSGSG